MNRTARAAALSAGCLLLTLAVPAGASGATAEPAPRVDLRVLVVSDGGPATDAVKAELDGQGTPYTEIDLTRADRPVITAGFLADTVSGRPRAKFQAVVLPNNNPFGTSSSEMTALATYEQKYAVPQVSAYTYASPDVGLEYPVDGYAGPLDGARAQVTSAGRSGPFGYLRDAVPFEDNSPTMTESYGYLSQPAAGADFTTYVDAPRPDGKGRGPLVGEYRHDGRRELVVTFVYNQYQQQFRLLARGIVDWMTGGVHLGASRNHFAVHVDDVFAADDRWDTELNCTPGDVDCPGGGGEPDPIRMTAEDATYAAAWSRRRGFTLDMVYNGAGSEQFRTEKGSDPLAARLIADKDAYRWVNHTYEHTFLGCVQDVSQVPWKCATDASGAVRWVSHGEIAGQISVNRQWGHTNGLPLVDRELVTGEHSGLKVLPQQPVDNPNLADALSGKGITWLGSDNSRDRDQRKVGSALTVPRFPMNIFYNAGRAAEQTDEYNWIYSRKADGGSGLCEGSATTTCLDAPLDPGTGYAEHIVPLETTIALGHVLSGDVRPHFIHQSNLAEDRIAYPVLDGVLDRYAALFTDSTPVVNRRMSDIGTELSRQAAFRSAVKANRVTAYRIGDTVAVRAPSGVRVPVTVPTGTRQVQLLGTSAFGTPYAGRLSAWAAPGFLQSKVTLKVGSAPTAPAVTAPAEVEVPAGARAGKVPAGAARHQEAGPEASSGPRH